MISSVRNEAGWEFIQFILLRRNHNVVSSPKMNTFQINFSGLAIKDIYFKSCHFQIYGARHFNILSGDITIVVFYSANNVTVLMKLQVGQHSLQTYTCSLSCINLTCLSRYTCNTIYRKIQFVYILQYICVIYSRI